jgi:DNA replication factor GINS
LTTEESDLFEGLVADIESNKHRVLDVLDDSAADTPEADAGADADADADEDGQETEPSPAPGEAAELGPADVMGGTDGESAAEPPTPPQPPDDHGVAEGDDPDRPLSGDGGTRSESVAPGDSEPETNVPDDPSPASVAPDDPSPETADTTPAADSALDPAATASANTDSKAAAKADTDSAGAASADLDSETADGEGPDPAAPDVNRTTVRITRDVGQILGVDDREYRLSNDDVVTLPEQNATPLVERDAAEPLE